jgi:hypothetical protein
VATRTNRSEVIPLRTTPAEKALIQEKAGGPRKVSAYLRRLALEDGEPAVRPENGYVAPEHETTPAFDRRVRELSRRMPKRNAEQVVRREEAKEKAKAALEGR